MNKMIKTFTQSCKAAKNRIVSIICEDDSSESEVLYCDSECSQCCSDLRSISMAPSQS